MLQIDAALWVEPYPHRKMDFKAGDLWFITRVGIEESPYGDNLLVYVTHISGVSVLAGQSWLHKDFKPVEFII